MAKNTLASAGYSGTRVIYHTQLSIDWPASDPEGWKGGRGRGRRGRNSCNSAISKQCNHHNIISIGQQFRSLKSWGWSRHHPIIPSSNQLSLGIWLVRIQNSNALSHFVLSRSAGHQRGAGNRQHSKFQQLKVGRLIIASRISGSSDPSAIGLSSTNVILLSSKRDYLCHRRSGSMINSHQNIGDARYRHVQLWTAVQLWSCPITHI